MIEAKSLTKKFIGDNKEFCVLENIDFYIRTDEFISIIGPSGCGKTTLLNIIAGLEKPTSGHVFIDNNAVYSPGLDRGMVFQESPLFPWKTILENIKLSLRIKGVNPKEINSFAKDYLGKVNLSDFAHFYPRELSGGMKQRAALARTLALGSNILLMDEPFGSLDAQTRVLMQEELSNFLEKQGRRTVLFVTHSIDEAIFLSDKIMVLSPLPAKVIKTIEVDLPRPRRQEFSSKKEFNDMKMEIWNLLKKEILKNNG